MPQPDLLQQTLARLLRQNPFLAALALRLQRRDDPTAKLAWTDGVHLAVNLVTFAQLPEPERLTLIAHECMHVALAHHLRRGQRDPSRWNHACDYAVNALLVADGFTLWERALHDPAFGDAAAEAIYERLPPQQDPAAGTPDAPTSGGAPAAGTDGLPTPDQPGAGADSPSATEPHDLGEVRDQPAVSPPTEADVQRQLADHAILITALAQQSRAAGSETAGARRAAAIARQPPAVNWRALLADFLSARTANDYSWCRPNPRYAPLGLYIPVLEARDLDRIAFVIDTSGSVPDQALTAVTAELEVFLTQHPTTSLLVVYADAQETGRVVLTADDLPLKLEPKGGGGTNFGPVLNSLEADEERPAAIVYFTDLHGSFPNTPPSVPVLWMVFGQANSQQAAPFGSVAILPY